MSFDLALIDGSGFAKAAYARGKRALAHRFLLRVFKTNAEERGVRQVVAWDPDDNAEGRRRRFPDYKKSRRRREEGEPNPNPGDFSLLRYDPEYVGELAELRRLLPTLGVAQAWSPGWEADDVLATLARGAGARGERVLVLTRDADLLQLVSDRVSVLLKVGSRETLYTPARAARDGVRVGEALTDWKALAGDPGDDVPGLPGVGPKTATALLDAYPDLINRFASEEPVFSGIPDRLEARVRTAIVRNATREGRERLALMRWLVELRDVPLRFVRGRLDPERARALFAEAGLRTLRARLREWER